VSRPQPTPILRASAIRAIAQHIQSDHPFSTAEMLVSAIEERHAPISRFFGPGIPGYRSAPRASFGVMASRLWLLFFLLIRGTHFVPTRTKLRLGLVQARHSAVCSYSECRINVEGGYRPEPSDISRNVLALVINASDRFAVLNDEVIRPIGVCRWRQRSWPKPKSHFLAKVACSVANPGTFRGSLLLRASAVSVYRPAKQAMTDGV